MGILERGLLNVKTDAANPIQNLDFATQSRKLHTKVAQREQGFSIKKKE